ncbi:MAG TPA: HAMP domain-containing sensor histidine kinase [Candidatus Limnocylindrales bacterium]|nr:HAMP domain-containing sensor histidine kinase [Candidatus Limnocylindrales bacterium]
MGGIRTRLALAIVGLVAVTVLTIGVGTYAFVDARLRDGLLADATRQAQFNLSVLVPGSLPAGANADTFDQTGLPAAFRLRGDVEEIVDFGDGRPYYSDAALSGALDALPAEQRSVVSAGHLGYAWQTLAGRPVLVVAGRAAVGPAIYFVFPAGSIDTALGQLRLGLAVAALIALVLAIATAGLIARGILRPVRSGSVAAARIAAGDLSARVPGGGTDEFARWAAEFNRMADSLESTVDRLAASESQNRRFVADVAHELRTPLTALVAEASLIESGLGDLSPDARRAAELLVADVRRLRTLVEDLMELSRFDAHAEEAERRPTDLGRIVTAAVAARLPDAAVFLPTEPVIVDSDVRRLDRIVGNLLDNARTHAPGTPVDVSVSRDGDGAAISVADRGPGVAPETLGHLFDRFFKAEPSRRSGSSGLGLAIAAEHAALLGGTLVARPRVGGGLEVSLTLPVTRSLPDGDPSDTFGAEDASTTDAMSAPTDPRLHE